MTGGSVNRRRFLALGAAAVGVAAVGAPFGATLFGKGQPGRLLRSHAPLPRPYQVPLPVPAVLQPVRTDAAADYYEITQQVAQLEILPGLKTSAWTYGGSFPGPTLVARSGRQTVVRHRNQLPQPTVVHLHGGHTPADSDGYPIDLLLPASGSGEPMAGMNMPGMSQQMPVGKTSQGERVHTYPGNQRAATLWYHDHRMGFTGPGVWRGLAGFHLVHDDEEQSLPLPHGERDIPLMIADRSFAEDGSFQYPSSDAALHVPGVTDAYMNGVLGDVILVNGAPWPVLKTDRARYRLRLLNASNARPYRLELDPQPPGGDGLVQIGGDGGLLERPVRHDALELAPAERFDVVVDFSRYQPGTSVRLVNRFGRGSTAEVMRFDVSSAPVTDDSSVPDRLSTIERLDRGRAVATRTFAFRQDRWNTWTINDQEYQPGRALARPKLGDIEVWRFVTDFHHPVHVHLNPFQVLSRNDAEPGPYDGGWKDTIDLQASEAVEIAVRFTDYTGAFMLHCHNLEHEDMAMMGDFVTE
ncbi:multicopper oxidase family protein [Kitasatospora sp. NPDC056531]|uniref:multicopper oxidase family protein n=1 Tax=Kitasatospora sp. NPDC056531 TaxID=3345856 RepID=UPI0036B20378